MSLNHPNWISTLLPFSLFGGASFLSFSQRQTFQKKKQSADHDPPSSGSEKISEKTCEMGWFLRCFLTMSRFLPGWFIPCFEIRSTSWWARPLCFWTSRAMRYLSIWMQLAERAYNDWPISTLIKLRAIYNLQWDRRIYVWVWWVSQVYNQKPWGILQVWVRFRAPSLLLSFEFLANLQAVKDLVVNLPRYLRSEATPHSRIVAGLS